MCIAILDLKVIKSIKNNHTTNMLRSIPLPLKTSLKKKEPKINFDPYCPQ